MTNSTRFTFLKAILSGMIVTQILATVELYLFNVDRYKALGYLQSQGILTIPNAITLHTLTELNTAVFGGLFFTQTVGVSIPCLTFVAFYCSRVFQQKLYRFIILLILWGILLVGMNNNGWDLWIGTYLTVVPLVTIFLIAGDIQKIPPNPRYIWGLGILSFMAVYILPQYIGNGTDFFIIVRDRLLLSNPIGVTINDFYYRYTLYPAELIKPIQQREIKTYHVKSSGNLDHSLKSLSQFNSKAKRKTDELILNQAPKSAIQFHKNSDSIESFSTTQNQIRSTGAVSYSPISQRQKEFGKGLTPPVFSTTNGNLQTLDAIRIRFADHGYYFVPDWYQADFEIEYWNGVELIIRDSSKPQGRNISLHQFSNNFDKELTRFSEQTDHKKIWRHFIFLSALMAAPFIAVSIFFSINQIWKWISIIPVGASLWFLLGSETIAFPQSTNNLITHSHQQSEIYRQLWQTGSKLDQIQPYIKSIKNGSTPERYWAIKSLVYQKDLLLQLNSEVQPILSKLLNDPHPNIVCQTLFVLGEIGASFSIPIVVDLFKKSDHLYVQLYAYQTLRKLGWKYVAIP